MTKTSIDGFNELFMGEMPKESVMLVTGAEGTLKSSLVLNVISNALSDNDEHGLYVTLEEDEDSLLRTMGSINIKKPSSLHIFDYKDIRSEWDGQDLDMAKITANMIDYYKDKYGSFTVFALDSLNAFYSLSNQDNFRKDIYNFFMMLRDQKLMSVLILECSNIHNKFVCVQDQMGQSERYLADGIIELGIVENQERVKRYIQIKKMRAVKHKMEKHQLIVGEDGLSVLGPVY